MMKRVMSVNYFGLVNRMLVCLPLLKKAQRPHLVGISAQAVRAAFTKAVVYGANKAAVGYCLCSLRVDLLSSKIDVTCILPGFVDTPLTQKKYLFYAVFYVFKRRCDTHGIGHNKVPVRIRFS